MATPPITALTAEELERNLAWLANEGQHAPRSIAHAVELGHSLLAAVQGDARTLAQLRATLRRAMGISPKSERRKNPAGDEDKSAKSRPVTPHERKARLHERLAALKDRTKRQRRRSRKMASEIKKLESRIQALENEGDDELTPAEQAEVSQEADACMQRLARGNGVDPTLVTAREALMTGECVTNHDEVRELAVPAELVAGATVVKTRVEERVRYDFSLALHRVVLHVEKQVIIDRHGERRIVSAPTTSVGPPRFSVTWEFLTNAVILVVLYALPMHRLARMLSSEERRFTASAICKMLRFVAEHVQPIYLQLFDELADAPILMGDDTSPRVLEVQQHFAQAEPRTDAPWHHWPKRNDPTKPSPLGEEGLSQTLARELGFCFARRSGEGTKQSLNTTVLAGRSQADESRSFIVFYRSHLGGLGNLLEVLLERREPNKKAVVVQSDLSTVNLVSDPTLRTRFAIQQVGCLAHARRPFARFEHEDPELCGTMLDQFGALAILEDALDECGRNRENVSAVRGVDSREVWKDIVETSELMAHKWSKQTKLGEAAGYILRHQRALSAYLDDPRLGPDNNLSERMLRMEKLIQSSSMFRVSLEGRFILDILRTVCQTATAAQVPVADYLLAVLKTPAAQIREAPEKFTPHAWAQAIREPATAK